VTAVNTEDELKTRLAALSSFQLELLLHAFKFPAAKKITYSTCSVHAEENEFVVKKALESSIAKEEGWQILRRENQIRGMGEWPVRGSQEACGEDSVLAESCIRANKGDEHGTMGFFLAGFVRDRAPAADIDAEFLRDERGHLVRDLLGMPLRVQARESSDQMDTDPMIGQEAQNEEPLEDKEWEGFEDEDPITNDDEPEAELGARPESGVHAQKKAKVPPTNKHSYNAVKKRPDLIAKDKKRRKGKKNS
jgi:putative methyltransferase